MLGLAAAGSTAAMAAPMGSYGATRVVAGVVFGLGLMLVMVGGGELFTSNNLIAMAWASRRVRTRAMLRNWGLVDIGNTVGAVSVALLYAAGGGYRTADSTVGNVIGGSVLVATVSWFIYLREIRGDTRP